MGLKLEPVIVPMLNWFVSELNLYCTCVEPVIKHVIAVEVFYFYIYLNYTCDTNLKCNQMLRL